MLSSLSFPRLFGLIIGIDQYPSNDFPSLRGAVADARALKAYLQDNLYVPQNHISILENESATRAAIIGAIQRLANDTRIQRGDPIIICYAGHGSQRDSPASCRVGGPKEKIQFILPYDAFCKSGKEVVQPIPGRTFGTLVDAIALEKGDNITVILDACHSTSGTRLFNRSSSIVRSVPPPAHFPLLENQGREIWGINCDLRSHVLLSACGHSGQAYEANRRGSFTAALLDLLQDTDIHKLRYRDIPMRIKVDSSQNPRCEGFNRGRSIFTSMSPSPTESYIPIYARLGNSVAIRIKEGKRQGFRLYSRPGDKVHEIFSLLPEKDHSLSNILVVNAPEDAQIHVSMEEDQVNFRFGHIGAANQGFRIAPTVGELARILRASSQFISELGRTADFPPITRNIYVEMYELQVSRWQCSDDPSAELLPLGVVPRQNEPFSLYQGSSYGLKVTNNSRYDLYPIVQYFDPSNEFTFNTLYEPAFSRSALEVPLKNRGGSLTVGYGSWGSCPLVIPLSNRESLGFLKISLFTQPLDPFYQARAFRLANTLPENLKGPWGTVILPVIHNRPLTSHKLPPHGCQEISTDVSHLGLNYNRHHLDVLEDDDENSVSLSTSGLKFQSLARIPSPLILHDSKPCLHLHKKASLNNYLLSRVKSLISRCCAAFRRPDNSSTPFSSKQVPP